jgi:hypothetical protein
VPTITCKSFVVDLHLNEYGTGSRWNGRRNIPKSSLIFRQPERKKTPHKYEMKPKLTCSLLWECKWRGCYSPLWYSSHECVWSMLELGSSKWTAPICFPIVPECSSTQVLTVKFLSKEVVTWRNKWSYIITISNTCHQPTDIFISPDIKCNFITNFKSGSTFPFPTKDII